MSLTGRTAAVAAAGQGQEQASALAALAAQQQHRASLLGAMNGGSAQRQASSAGLGGVGGGGGSQSDKVSSAILYPFALRGFANRSTIYSLQNSQQPWAASPSPAPSSFPSSLLSNGTPAPASAASSPLPPAPSAGSDQLRSPSMGSAGGGGGAAAALLAQVAQQSQNQSIGAQTPRSVSSVASNALPPPPNSTTSQAAPGTGQVPQTPVQQVLFSPADRFGLIGLLHIIKSANTDQGMLALGNDLTNLGLDLGAPE